MIRYLKYRASGYYSRIFALVKGEVLLLVTENGLDEWVRGNEREAQGLIVELIKRLVSASCPNPQEHRFPSSDSIGQHGPDGILEVLLGYEPYIPEGRSFWEIGTGIGARAKATADYKKLTETVPREVREESAFVFVTPLSATRDWECTWKEGAQQAWLDERLNRREWRRVSVIDGSKLVEWIHSFPSVELWLAGITNGLSETGIEILGRHWDEIRKIGELPPLTPHLFLANREEACNALRELFAGERIQLKLETRYPGQTIDFVAAYVAQLDSEKQAEASGRCLIISSEATWDRIARKYERHILVAAPSLDLSGYQGTKLIQLARNRNHAIVFGAPKGGIPDPSSVLLRTPRAYQIKEALEKAGYAEERARILAQRYDRDLDSLLRCLQNLSLVPEWAEKSMGSDLVIASLLGSWSDKSVADRASIEELSGNSYGEWIGKIREISLNPGTPLACSNNNWKLVSRYEAWYGLGPRIFDEKLDDFKRIALAVLKEKDPKFDMPQESRYTAQIYGKQLSYSRQMRFGIAGTLALMGSHPDALTSCPHGKAERVAAQLVRDLLRDADWKSWASLNELLPLLAEAAPEEFLFAVESALDENPSIFDELFSQESKDGFLGENYMTGLLWALETLAWGEDFLSRVVVYLGKLALQDPGGTWTNRPTNSLITILLPWLPQTCAPVEKRVMAVSRLLVEVPEVGWQLLMCLLPGSHSVSSGSRKPEWRELIPEDWSKGVTHKEYWEQVKSYAEMSIKVAESDIEKLEMVIDHIDALPREAFDMLLELLESERILGLADADKLRLWSRLSNVVTKHRNLSDAEWAMKPDIVDRLSEITGALAPRDPFFGHQRLFNEDEFDLNEENDEFEEQTRKLEKRRRNAVKEIYTQGSVRAVVDFASCVRKPWFVGIFLGEISGEEIDGYILPVLLGSEQKELAQFASGFVRGRSLCFGWSWVDKLDISKWSSEDMGRFLSFLPFTGETWDRAKRFLGLNESIYWREVSVNPYEASTELWPAIDRLIEYGRPIAAISCFGKIMHDKKKVDPERAIRALIAARCSTELPSSRSAREIVKLIKTVQDEPTVKPEDIYHIEWVYLPLLDDEQNEATPRCLGHRMSTDPSFFCEVIGYAFRSVKESHPAPAISEENCAVAQNAYRLLGMWKTPPGSLENGEFDGEALKDWLGKVKKECFESGHLAVALVKVGHVLAYAPPDPEGLWIHRSVAETLDAKDAEDMRDGFRTELYNSRGIHPVDLKGGQEKTLAEKYRLKAEEIEQAGSLRLGATLRKLAREYESEAKELFESDRLEDY